MKKKMVLALCALLLMLPALVCAEVVSITELRQQVEEMGRWTQTYEAHGRTIEVDVPIIVPKAEKMPVAIITALCLYDDADFEEHNRSQGAEVTRGDKQLVIEYRIEPDEQNDIEKWRNNIFRITCNTPTSCFVRGQYNDPDDLLALHPNNYVVPPYVYYYPREVNVGEAYAEENPLTIQDVNDSLKKLLEKLGLAQLELQMKKVCVAGRGRIAKNFNEAALGALVDYVPMGFYSICYAQKFFDVPVILYCGSLYDHKSMFELGERVNVGTRGNAPGGELNYRMMDECSYAIDSGLGLAALKEVVERDVPLAPLSKVIHSIEEKIESGNIRDVYNLQLGYAVFLAPYESEPQQYYLFPFWNLECTWLDSAQKEKSTHPDPGYAAADFRVKLEYREIGINAQTGELVVPSFTKRSKIMDDLYDCPEIITWEEAH